jgi:tRNA(fMet)-specific endonuclease VapC
MSFLVDTDTCSAFLKNVRVVSNRFLQHGGLHISVVTVAELGLWLRRKRTPKRYWRGYQALEQNVTVLDLDLTIAAKAGEVGAEIYDKGRPIDVADLLIATTALVHGLTLVTHNTLDFAHVPGLTTVDWLIL